MQAIGKIWLAIQLTSGLSCQQAHWVRPLPQRFGLSPGRIAMIKKDVGVTDSFEKLGAPNLKLEGLQIWIHGRQFPDLHDYWDGNWLHVTAHCGGNGATVFATGPILHLSEFDRWLAETEQLLKNLSDARLACVEPALSVTLKAGSLGHITMEVSITPDHMTQRHWFQFKIDQSYLPPLAKQCRSILEAYPIRGSRGE
ncbi:MAG TPA: hypothetical protein VIJ55_12605 [Acetobacteraceae bacterium]